MIVIQDVTAETAQQLCYLHDSWGEGATPQYFRDLDAIGKSLTRPEFADRQKLFLYYHRSPEAGGRPVGHAVARVSPTIKDRDGKPLGTLGFFAVSTECHDIKPLLGESVDWLKQNGADSIVGPMDGDTWHRYRLNTGPWDDPPFLMEPENPSYYAALWKQAGWQVVDRYHSKTIDDVSSVVSVLRPDFEAACHAGFQFRPLRMSEFGQELDRIYQLSTTAFRGSFLYDDISRDQFLALYQGVRPLVEPSLIWFAMDQDGREIGFLFCVIDYYRAVSAMRGKRNWWAKLKFLIHRRIVDAVNFKSIGILPEHRRHGLATALMYLGYRASLDLGFLRSNLCLIRDGNPSAQLDAGKSRMLRRYELYQAPGSNLRDL